MISQEECEGDDALGLFDLVLCAEEDGSPGVEEGGLRDLVLRGIIQDLFLDVRCFAGFSFYLSWVLSPRSYLSEKLEHVLEDVQVALVQPTADGADVVQLNWLDLSHQPR